MPRSAILFYLLLDSGGWPKRSWCAFTGNLYNCYAFSSLRHKRSLAHGSDNERIVARQLSTTLACVLNWICGVLDMEKRCPHTLFRTTLCCNRRVRHNSWRVFLDCKRYYGGKLMDRRRDSENIQRVGIALVTGARSNFVLFVSHSQSDNRRELSCRIYINRPQCNA